jgi:hypothetical protein
MGGSRTATSHCRNLSTASQNEKSTLPLSGFEPVTFNMPIHLSDRLANSYPRQQKIEGGCWHWVIKKKEKKER